MPSHGLTSISHYQLEGVVFRRVFFSFSKSTYFYNIHLCHRFVLLTYLLSSLTFRSVSHFHLGVFRFIFFHPKFFARAVSTWIFSFLCGNPTCGAEIRRGRKLAGQVVEVFTIVGKIRRKNRQRKTQEKISFGKKVKNESR